MSIPHRRLRNMQHHLMSLLHRLSHIRVSSMFDILRVFPIRVVFRVCGICGVGFVVGHVGFVTLLLLCYWEDGMLANRLLDVTGVTVNESVVETFYLPISIINLAVSAMWLSCIEFNISRLSASMSACHAPESKGSRTHVHLRSRLLNSSAVGRVAGIWLVARVL